MTTINNPWIKLKETIDQDDYDLINNLKKTCIHLDEIELKLELDYKLNLSSINYKNSNIQQINEFMYFDGQKIIGYIGICNFGGPGSAIEVNGMVHPEYRRQGVFKRLWELVLAEWKRRNSPNILLLSDRKSDSGQKFIEGTRAEYKHSEYEMYLEKRNTKSFKHRLSEITLRKATNKDASEVARQNEFYFNDETNVDKDAEKEINNSTKNMILPEEEEKRGMTIYIAEKNHQVIGKVHVELTSTIGGIYGLGVLPEYRGKGFGRTVLLKAIELLKEKKAKEVMLQVEAKNSNALNLYKSCGFVITSMMDYYEIRV